MNQMNQMMTHLERITPIVKLNLKLQIKSKSLYDYSVAYIPVKGTVSVAAADAATNNNNKR